MPESTMSLEKPLDDSRRNMATVAEAANVTPPIQSEVKVVVNLPQGEDSKAFEPVAFSALFRFSTRTEIFLDVVGIICAVIAGAAQVS